MIADDIRAMAKKVDDDAGRYGWYPFATTRQIIALQILFKEITLKRGERLAVVSELFQRPITSFKDLTHGEASSLLSFGYEDVGVKLEERIIRFEFLVTLSEIKEKQNAEGRKPISRLRGIFGLGRN